MLEGNACLMMHPGVVSWLQVCRSSNKVLPPRNCCRTGFDSCTASSPKASGFAGKSWIGCTRNPVVWCPSMVRRYNLSSDWTGGILFSFFCLPTFFHCCRKRSGRTPWGCSRSPRRAGKSGSRRWRLSSGRWARATWSSVSFGVSRPSTPRIWMKS